MSGGEAAVSTSPWDELEDLHTSEARTIVDEIKRARLEGRGAVQFDGVISEDSVRELRRRHYSVDIHRSMTSEAISPIITTIRFLGPVSVEKAEETMGLNTTDIPEYERKQLAARQRRNTTIYQRRQTGNEGDDITAAYMKLDFDRAGGC